MNTEILKGGLIALVGLAIVIDLFIVRTDPMEERDLSDTDINQVNRGPPLSFRPNEDPWLLDFPSDPNYYERSSSEGGKRKSKKYSERICLKQSKSLRRLVL